MTNFSLNRRQALKSGFAAGVVALGGGVLMVEEAMAATKAIPGIGIRVQKRPGGSNKKLKTATGSDGSFRFNGLAPGSYDVIVGNGPTMVFVVGKNGVLAGKAMQDGAKPMFAVQDSSAN